MGPALGDAVEASWAGELVEAPYSTGSDGPEQHIAMRAIHSNAQQPTTRTTLDQVCQGAQ